MSIPLPLHARHQQSPVRRSPALRRLATVVALVVCASATARAADDSAATFTWSDYGPGTIRAQPAAEPGPDGATEAITLALDGRPDGYWCGARAVLAKPSPANRIEFSLSSSQAHTVHVKLVGSKGETGYYELWPAVGDWRAITLRREFPQHTGGPGAPVPADVAAIEFIFFSPEFGAHDTVVVSVSGLRVATTPIAPYLNRDWLPATVPPPVPGYRIETCIHNIWGNGQAQFGGLDHPPSFAMAMDVYDHLRADFGNVGITIAYLDGTKGREFADHLRGTGGTAMAEGHMTEGEQFLRDHDSFARNDNGQTLLEWPGGPGSVHAHDYTHPATLEAEQQKLLRAAKAGATIWRTVDYVWQWWGGNIWGHSDAARRRWREDLAGTDIGLELGKGIEPGKPTDRRVATFWDYYESYHGCRLVPADLGIASWDQYDPPKPGRPTTAAELNNARLFDRLFHYEWLKFANEVARPATAAGLMHQPICNPEFDANGTDLAWLLRLANVRGFASEWWGHPAAFLGTYYNGRYYDAIARANGKEIVFLGESGAAGGNAFDKRPNYWDNQANFLITYAQAGAVDAKAKHDQYWGSAWSRMSDPKELEYQSFTAFRSAWCGFLQARNDHATKPKAAVLALTDRFGGFDGSSTQALNIAATLVTENYLHDGGAFPLDDAFRLDDYQTIVLSTTDPPVGSIARLGAWVAAAKGRTLITSCVVPTRTATAFQEAPADALLRIGDQAETAALGLKPITLGTTARGVVRARDPHLAAALGALAGTTVSFAQPLYRAAGGEALATLDDEPLVSVRTVGKGRVVYLHFVPGQSGVKAGAIEAALIDGVMRSLGYRPTLVGDPRWRGVAYDLAGGDHAFMLYKSDARMDLTYEDRVFGVFQAEDREATGRVKVLIGRAKARYRLTDLITGRAVEAASDADGYLPVVCDGWNMRGVVVHALP